jgi:uncharacterized damage-inducible protein DinB
MTAFTAQRPAPDEYDSHFAGYVARVPEGDVLAHLAAQVDRTCALLARLTGEQSLFRYAPGKWTIREVVGHVTDAERVFAYRGLRAARGDVTPLPSFDENLFVANARFNRRSLDDLVGEFRDVRRATLSLARSLDEPQWTRRGVAGGHPVSVRACLYMIAGHELHHVDLLGARYGLR